MAAEMAAVVAAVESTTHASVQALPRQFGDTAKRVPPLGFSDVEQRLSRLDGGNELVLNGIDPDDDSERVVRSAGDVNGDGVDDLLLAANGADPNGALLGEVYVVFGIACGFPASLDLDTLNGGNGFTLHGVTAFDRAGLAVDSASDDIDDLLIGALDAGTSADNSS